MKIALLSNEFPPHVYGGAGVHVEYLSKELAHIPHNHVDVYCFGEQAEKHHNLNVHGVQPDFTFPSQNAGNHKLMDTLMRDILIAGTAKHADIVHCHTWYSHFAGCLLKPLLGAPLVLTTHSLEPHRPWKVEQLGNAYHVSSWLEKTAYQNADGIIAVSESMQRDVHELYSVPLSKIRVIPNGIDLKQYKPTPNPELLRSFGIDPELPYVLFVGRITRQKGVIHLLNAIPHMQNGLQVVLCAGAPDTKEIGKEMEDTVAIIRANTPNPVIWIPQMLSKEQIIPIYTHATLFICPSVYEPFGIINLEAMACETPVIASAVGGIPEVVVHGETGLLIPFQPISSENFEPKNSDQFSEDIAEAVNHLLQNPERLISMAKKSRARVEKYFSWSGIAEQTSRFYEELIHPHA